MSKVSIKGVLIGGIVDILATNVAAIPLLVYAMTQMKTTDAPTASSIVSLLHADAPLWSIQLGVGLACSVLGGYVGARIARHDEVLNGALSSYLCILFGIYAAVSGKTSTSLAEHGLYFAVSFAAAALGGFLARRKPTKLPPA